MGRDEVLADRQPFDEVGLDRTLDDLALRIRHQASHTGQLADLLERATGAGVGHHEDRVELTEVVLHRLTHFLGGRIPLVRDLLVAFLGGVPALVELGLDPGGLLVVLGEDLFLLRRRHDVVLRHGDAGPRGEGETQLLEGVEHLRDRRGAVGVDQPADHVVDVLLLHRLIDEGVGGLVVLVLESLGQRPLDAVVEDDPPDRGQEVLVTVATVLRVIMERDDAVLVCELGLLRGPERMRRLLQLRRVELGHVVARVGQVVETQHHVLRRGRQRRTMGRREDVVGRQHQDPGLGLGLGAERHVDRHLVAVEVGVEGRADERVDLNGLAFDQDRLEGLDAETVKRRGAVQQNRMLLDHLFEHVPDLGNHRLDHLLGGLDVLDRLALDKLGHDERLEQLEGHQLRQAALVQLQRRAGHDDRTARVVDALAEQVLTEPALLALEHVRERLQRPVARSGDRTATAAVVEQGVNRLLQHALLVVDDDLRRTQVQKPLEAVVPVDDATVEVVQVGGREAATVELDHRTQLRRDHRDAVEDHPLGLVLRLQEGRSDLQALDRAGLLLPLGGVDLVLEFLAGSFEVDLLQQVAHRLGAHAAAEVLTPAERAAETVLQLTEDGLVVDHVLRLHGLEDLPDFLQPLDRLFDVRLGVIDLGLEILGEFLDLLGAIVVAQLAKLGGGQAE